MKIGAFASQFQLDRQAHPRSIYLNGCVSCGTIRLVRSDGDSGLVPGDQGGARCSWHVGKLWSGEASEGEDEPVSAFYYVGHAQRDHKGTIGMRMSAYSESMHTSLALTLEPSDADYDFWLWLIARSSDCDPPFISDEDVARYKFEFQQAQALLGADFLDREATLSSIPMAYEQPFGEKFWFGLMFFAALAWAAISYEVTAAWERIRGSFKMRTE